MAETVDRQLDVPGARTTEVSGAQRRRLTPRTREALWGIFFISPWLLGFLVFVGGAMIASLVMSLFETDLMTPSQFVGLKHFGKALQSELVHKALINTAYYSFTMVPAGTIVALMIAVALNQHVKGLSVYRMIYYLPAVVSGVAVSMLWAWLYDPDFGLINGFLASVGIQGPRWIHSEVWAMPSMIIMGLWSSGASMLIFLAGLQSIPTTLYEAAKIDGANAWHSFWNVTIPMLTPTIFFSLIMRIIGSWQVFTQSYVMTEGGPNNATLTMVLHLYNKGFTQLHFGYASALAWLLFTIILIFTALVFRSSALWVYYEGEIKK
jgi:multiple sugar transport system permease protein